MRIKIDRSRPFQVEGFYPEPFQEEVDETLLLEEIELEEVQLIYNHEFNPKLHFPLDAQVFTTLDGDHSLIPERWKDEIRRRREIIKFVGGVRLIDWEGFPGSPTLSLVRKKSGEEEWMFSMHGGGENNLYAVLAFSSSTWMSQREKRP